MPRHRDPLLQSICFLRRAAERAWDAAHGEEVHYMAGKRAQQAKFAQRFIPGRLRRQLIKSLPPRA